MRLIFAQNLRTN